MSKLNSKTKVPFLVIFCNLQADAFERKSISDLYTEF